MIMSSLMSSMHEECRNFRAHRWIFSCKQPKTHPEAHDRFQPFNSHLIIPIAKSDCLSSSISFVDGQM